MDTTSTTNYTIQEKERLNNVNNQSNYLTPNINITQPPPPYDSTTSPLTSPYMEKVPSMDQLIYQKMLNLESMVSNIQETVIDQSTTYKDVNTQLKEINQTMANFQKEASMRLRQKLTGSPYPKASSIFSQSSSEEINLDSSNTQQEEQVNEEPEQHNEDSDRYDRVCSMLENLITDAESVLETKSPSAEEVPLPSDDEDLLEQPESTLNLQKNAIIKQEIEDNNEETTRKEKGNEIKVELFCQVSRGGRSLRKHRLSKRLILPLVDEQGTIDNQRLAILPAFKDPNSVEPIITEPDDLQLMATTNKIPDIEEVNKMNPTPMTFVTLLYWSFLFTLGTILLDSTLCNMAGFQVLNILDNLSDGETTKQLKARKGANTSESIVSSSSSNEDAKNENSATESGDMRRKSF